VKIAYVGERTPERALLVFVRATPDAGEVSPPSGQHRRALPMRLGLMNHSPTGYECGYEGSGPAQLALAICAEHFKRHPIRAESAALLLEDFEPRETIGDRMAVMVHQSFKRAIVAALPRVGGWTVTDEQVAQALDTLIAAQVAAHALGRRQVAS
jgi:hypothetical protein